MGCHPFDLGTSKISRTSTLWYFFSSVPPPVFQINFGLLIFSFTGFLLPGYLFFHRRNLLREQKARDSQPAIQEMEALKSTEANGFNKPHSNGNALTDA